MRVVHCDENGITLRTFCGKKQQRRYEDIWGIEKDRILHFETDAAWIPGNAEMRRNTVDFLQRQYQKRHNRKRIPKVFSIKRQFDPFNGNLLHPIEMTILGIFALLLAAAWTVILFIADFSDEPWYIVLEMILIDFLGWGIGIATFYVGRHADTLPPWVVRLVFKKTELSWECGFGFKNGKIRIDDQ